MKIIIYHYCIIVFFIILSQNLFPQPDSLNTNKKDSLVVLTDIFSDDDVKPDTLIPIFNQPLYKLSTFISNEKIINTNYRYLGDVLLLSPLSSIRDYGFIGYPNTLSLYGNVPNSTSILKDGIQINERYLNYFNLNMIQTEEIDSIEIMPLPRAALYSSYINPSSVNIITKDFLPAEPFSRIKYYQGPDREAFINGYFNAEVLKKLFLSFAVTNRIKNATYLNSDFSIWQGNFKLKYLLSNKINFVLSYDINDYKAGFNGGVDYDSVLKLTSKPEDLIYDPLGAPVVLPNGELEISSHLPRLTIKSKFFNWLNSDLSLFYMFNKSSSKKYYYSYLEDKVLGTRLSNRINFEDIEIGLIFDFEKIKDYNSRQIDFYISPFTFQSMNLITKKNTLLFSYASYIALKPFSKNFSLSLFYKHSKLKEEVDKKFYDLNKLIFTDNFFEKDLLTSSIGVDLTSQITDKFSFYIGYSIIGKYLEKNNLDYLLFESSINYKGDLIEASIRYFINEYQAVIFSASPLYPTFFYTNNFGDLSGITSDIRFNYQFILFESKTNYFWKLDSEKIYNTPVYSSRNGIYYYNKLFNDNLDLKAGILLNILGNQNTFQENKNTSYLISTNPVQTIDFSLSGTIQKRATLYFIWENLLNKKYFLIPYFPMPERNIRFGVSWEFYN